MAMTCPVCRESYADWANKCSVCGVGLVQEGDHIDPRTLPEENQVIYELEDWTLDQRTELGERLAEAEIDHAWEDTELIVADVDEEVVDSIVAFIDTGGDPNATEVTYELETWTTIDRSVLEQRLSEAQVTYRWEPGFTLVVAATDEDAVDNIVDIIAPPEDLDDRPEARSTVLDDLFTAADELSRDGLSKSGTRRLTAVIGEVDECSAPFGLDPAVWEQIADSADSVADAVLDDGGNAERIAALASELREVLRPHI
jgi:hypothetical protein